MDFLLPTGLSMPGLKAALLRMKEGTEFSESGFLNSTRINPLVALQKGLAEILENQLRSIGFYEDKFTFLIKTGNDWKSTEITLYKFLQNLATGTYKSGQIVFKDHKILLKDLYILSKFLYILSRFYLRTCAS